MAIYFIEALGAQRTKIGWSDNPHARLIDLQTAHFLELRLIRVIDGRRGVECWLHNHFEALHVKGEWYHSTPEMLTIEPGEHADLARLDRSFHERRDQIIYLLNHRPDLKYIEIAQVVGVPIARLHNWIMLLQSHGLAPQRRKSAAADRFIAGRRANPPPLAAAAQPHAAPPAQVGRAGVVAP